MTSPGPGDGTSGAGDHRVREARPDDLPALRAIQSATLAEPWRELLELGASGPPTLLVVDEPASVPDAAGAGESATGDRTPVGYALAVADGDEGYLAELAVRDAYRGEGRGTALLAALLDRFRTRGIERVRVTVRAVDEHAREFYRRHGFDRTERLPDHYERGDGFLLERELE